MSQSNPRPGWLRWKDYTSVQRTLIAIAVITLVLIVVRFGGYLLQRYNSDATPKPQPTASPLPASVTLGGFNQKFYYYSPEKKALYEFNPLSNATTRLTDAALSIKSNVTAPDQKKLALLSVGETANQGVYIFDASDPTKPLQEVVSKPEFLAFGFILQPNSTLVWSPQSTQIAIVAYKENRPNLFVAPVSTQGRVQFLRSPGNGLGTVVWLDEQTITFETQLDGKTVLFKVNSDGGNLQLLKPQ